MHLVRARLHPIEEPANAIPTAAFPDLLCAKVWPDIAFDIHKRSRIKVLRIDNCAMSIRENFETAADPDIVAVAGYPIRDRARPLSPIGSWMVGGLLVEAARDLLEGKLTHWRGLAYRRHAR